jgi:hypothetical protein
MILWKIMEVGVVTRIVFGFLGLNVREVICLCVGWSKRLGNHSTGSILTKNTNV